MTTPMIPSFILTLFENEIRAIVLKSNLAISEQYNLNISELNALTEEKVGLILKIIPEEFENVTIKKTKPRKIIDPYERCIARLKVDGKFCQCTFRFCNDKNLCGKHIKMNLKFGTINDPLPIDTFRRRKQVY